MIRAPKRYQRLGPLLMPALRRRDKHLVPNDTPQRHRVKAGPKVNAPIDPSETMARIFRRLDELGCDPRDKGDGIEAICPVHRSSTGKRSLSVKYGNRHPIIFHCMNPECSQKAILEMLGLGYEDVCQPSDGRVDSPSERRATPELPPSPKGKQPKKGKASLQKAIDDACWGLQQPEIDKKTGEIKKPADPTWKHSQTWRYPTADNTDWAWVARFDNASGEKEYRPLHTAEGKFFIGDPPGKLPLYNLPDLASARLVYWVEGEKAADALTSLGFIATTTMHGAKSPKKSDLDPVNGIKEVVVCPDDDKAGEVYLQALLRLFAELPNPPTVRVLRLENPDADRDSPDWVETKRDAFDLIKRKREEEWSDAEIREGIERLVSGLPVEPLPLPAPKPSSPSKPVLRVVGVDQDDVGPPVKTIEPNEAPDDPSRLARLFLDACRHEGDLTLRYWQGEFHLWTGAYQTVLDGGIRARLHPTIKAEFDRLNLEEIADWEERQKGPKPAPQVRKVTNNLVSNTVLALQGYTLIPERTLQPSWLEESKGVPFPAKDVLPMKNALIHLPSYIAGHPDAIHPPTSRFFCPYALDYDFDPQPPKPMEWFAFLRSIFDDDVESIDALQDWMGLQLTPDTSHQKIGMLIGPKRSGKGTIARVMKGLLGEANVANPTLSSLSANFGLSPLIGKPTAIISDARLSGRTDVAQVVERLLSISGEDGQTIDRKHLPAVTVNLPTRFTIISNELPRFSDSSGALAGRMILLELTKTFFGNEDLRLTDRLLGELPGILLWAIGGWKRLRERGRLIQPESGKAMVEEMEDLASPVGAFLKDCCEVKPGFEVATSELYAAWKEWCHQRGRDKPGDAAGFGRSLRAVLPGLGHTPNRLQPDGSKQRFYEGIRLVDRIPNGF